MLDHYTLWLAFTAETPIHKQERWLFTASATDGFTNERRKK
jgi:hypothetical protein